MGRTLKFRTWDKNRQSFIGPVNLLGDQKYVVLPENWPWENYCEAVNLSTSAKTLEGAAKQRNEYARENWIIQQWTGLLDSAGREIYEGDIVKGSRNYWVSDEDFEDFAEILEVKFGPLDYCKAQAFKFVTKDGCDLDFYGGPPSQDQMVVVGNIFQNRELLVD